MIMLDLEVLTHLKNVVKVKRVLVVMCLRGCVTKKKGKIWEKFPKGGGGNRRKFPISIWEFDKPRGVSIFQKCLNFNYFAIILQYYLYKKCLKFKKF